MPLVGLILGIGLAFRRWREPPAPEADALALSRTRLLVQSAAPPRPSRFSGTRREALRFLSYMTVMPLFRRIRGGARGVTVQERLELDRPRRTSLLASGEIRRRVFILKESFYSHRRLQLIVLLLALFSILGGGGYGFYLNQSLKA